jgi:hypothetical protein
LAVTTAAKLVRAAIADFIASSVGAGFFQALLAPSSG